MLEIMVQPHDVSGDYQRWREVTESRERDWKRRGRLAVRVVVDPDVFLAWCAARAMEPNGYALQMLVNERTLGRAVF
jgi:hypothetical protein